MKKVDLLKIVFFFFTVTNLFAQSASVIWSLTSDQNPNTPTGNIQASPQIIGAGSGTYLLQVVPLINNPYGSYGQRLWMGNQGTAWLVGPPDYTRYIQFDTSPTSGNDFTVQNVSFQYSDFQSPNNNEYSVLKAEVWYAIDNNWGNSVQLNLPPYPSPLNYSNISTQTFSKSINVQVQNGHTFSVRIYPYAQSTPYAMIPAFATHRNVIIEGKTSPVVTTGSICGMKFNDRNGDGLKNGDDEGLPGWTINLSMGAVQMSTTTGADGSYCFNNLPAGTYTLSETPQGEWRQTFPGTPGTHTVVLTQGQRVMNIDFGNKKKLGFIAGYKFNDINGNGDQQIPAEPGLGNWTIILSGPVSDTMVTGSYGNNSSLTGYYRFDNLPAGTYTISEINQLGWQPTYPSSGAYTVILSEGEGTVRNFGNRQVGSICGKKFNDLNGNGKNDNEPGLSGWVIELKYNGPNGEVTLKDTTDSEGNYCFNNLPWNTFTLTEVNKNGWTQTAPTAPGSYTITINSEINLIGYDFGNKEIINPNCTDYENNSMNGWQANNISTSFQQNGNNHYIQTTDQAGVSTFYTTSKPYIGNWTSLFSNGCGSLCFDVTFLYGGDTYNGVNPPQTFTPQIMIEGNGFQAGFVAYNQITVGDGWHSYCAPLSFLNSDGTLPSNSDGYWIMTVGTANDWNTLLTNVTKVRLPVDPTSFQREKFGYDNICLKNTGDCNSPLRLGSICGFKILDKNGDGKRDSNEDIIPGWKIILNDGTRTFTTTTDANGKYCFDNLPAGAYTLSEEQRPGMKQIFPPDPGVHTITLLPGEHRENINFSNIEDINIKLGSICGIKFNDINGDGHQDLPGEFGMPNWTFQLTGAANMTVTTDPLGNFCFTNLREGTYTIKEMIQDGWEPTTPNSTGIYSVTLLPGQNIEVKFGNKEKLGSICGVKYNDLNNNGRIDVGEPGIAGWQISISSYQNTYTGQGGLGNTLTLLSVVTTDKNGEYCFNNLKPGSYLIGEYHKDGWTQTEPSSIAYQITLSPGQKIEKINFGNHKDSAAKVGSICGIKFNDKNGDGDQDPGESGIADWQIYLGGPIDMSTRTDKDGRYCFENLIPGEYKVGEEARSRWRQTKPSTNFYIIQLASGDNKLNVDFGNVIDDKVQLGSICGTKFNDKNRDGRQANGELGIKGWAIYLEGPMNLTAVTDDNGYFCFYGLIPGTYTVREENKTGWRQTKPSSITYTLEIGNGTNFTGIDFGNTQDPTVTYGSVCGIKFNDLNGNGKQDNGEPGIANWTINITLSGAITQAVKTDLRGKFCFEKLRFGHYTLFESMKDGWKPTAPTSGSYTFELYEGNANPDTFYFGNQQDISIKNGSICGIKFNDKNGNGRKDAGEDGIYDWQINLGGPIDLSIRTDRYGNFCFDNLKPGVYTIKEEPKTNWIQTYPTSPGSYTITLSFGENKTDIDFGNKYEPKVGCVNPPSGMKAWWPFDVSSTNSRQDLAGYNNSGTMMNGPTQVAGKVLGALQFDGVDDYVEVADHSELNFGTGDFSFDAWIKTSDNSTGPSILLDKRKETSGILGISILQGYEFFLNSGYLALQIANGVQFDSYLNVSSPVFVADGNWHHIAVTVSRTNKQGIVFYLDGVPVQYGDPTGYQGSINNDNILRIGAQSFVGFISGIRKFKGILDEIELFNRVLTPSEIVSIYNAGSAGKCKPNSAGGSVSGAVWYDTNHNGVKDPTEVGLTEWTVFLNGPSIVQTETDENGNFNFDGCKPGSYTLSIAKPNGWAPTRPGNGTNTFELGPAQTIDGINFGFANDPCGSGNKSWYPLDTGVNGWVISQAVIGTDIYAGGNFTIAGGVNANRIAKWNGMSWSDVGGGVSGAVNSLVAVGTDIYVGGQFNTAGSTNAKNIAKWNGTSWSPLGNGINGTVISLVAIGMDLYAGGQFTTAGGVSVNNIAKWNGTNWSPLGSGINGTVYSLVAIGTDIYAGGQFTTAGGVSVNNIAKWNGTSWSTLSNGVNDRVMSLATNGTELYAGGQFTTAGGLSANGIAKWNGINWSPLGTGVSNNANFGTVGFQVSSIEIDANYIYIGGFFSHAGAVAVNSIAKFDGLNWSALGSGMSGPSGLYNSNIQDIKIIGSDLYAGGIFTSAGGVNANNIARYSCSGNITSVGDENSNFALPQQFDLSQNYPNPFNPATTIRYDLPKAGLIKITVYDILGREVKVLLNEWKNPGQHQVIFDAKGLASGVYFYTINTGNFVQSKKMILLK